MGNFLKHIHPLLRRKRSKDDYEDVNFAIIQSLKTELEDTEDEAIKSKIQSSLKTAKNEYLDTYGDWFGVYRMEDEDDEHYRQRIIDYVLLKRGTNNAIIESLKNYLEDYESKISIYEPYTNIFYTNKSFTNGKDKLMGFYYRFAIIDITIGRPFPESVIDIINSFKPAGVTFYLTYDGSYQMSGDGVIDLPSTNLDIDWYTTTDIFDGFGLLSYGHLGLGNKKRTRTITYDPDEGRFVDLFRTNYSDLNGSSVLSGDPSVGKIYYNTAYNTNRRYEPTHDDYSTDIEKKLEGNVTPLDYDFYSKTDKKDENPARYTITGKNSIENFYMALDIYRFFQDNYRQEVKKLNQKETISYIKENAKKPKFSYTIRGLLEPNEENYMELKFYNFSSTKWETIDKNVLMLGWTDSTLELGNLHDFISDNGLIFTNLNLNTTEKFTFELDYIDLSFEYRKDNIYTIRPFLGNISNEFSTVMGDFSKYFKLASLDRADIMTQPGYQPMQYLRLTDGYDNSINRNLLLDSKKITNENTRSFDGTKFNLEYKSNGLTRVTTSGGESLLKLLRVISEINSYNGDELSLSFDIIAYKPVKMYLNGITSGYSLGESPMFNSSERQRFLWKSIKPYEGGSKQIQFRTLNEGEDLDFEIGNIKIEKGEKATPYQPNPEDLYGANDPNRYIDLQAKDVDGNKINSETLPTYYNKKGMNLLKNEDIIQSNNVGSYVKGDTKELDVSLWGTRITPQGSMGEVLKPNTTYTISYNMEMMGEPDIPVFRQSPGIIVYSRNPARVIAETRFVNSKDTQRHIPVGTQERVELTFTMPQVDNIELTAYAGLFNETGDSTPMETRQYSKVKFTDIKIEEGFKATPYSPNPEDEVKFLDKTIKFSGAYNNIQTLSILNSIDLEKVYLEYSIFGDQYTKIKELTDIKSGETHTDNETVDLYGVSYVSYDKFSIMSNVLLGTIYDEKLGEITAIPGGFMDMPNDFFNTDWTTTDYKGTLSFGGMNVLRDSINGVLDNTTGIITRLNTLQKVESDTITEITEEIPIESIGKITMGSNITFEDVYNKPIGTEEIDIKSGIRVI